MVQTHNQTHESEQNPQGKDPPIVRSKKNLVGQNDQDSSGVTSEVLSLQLAPLVTQGQQNHIELMGIMRGVLRSLDGLAEQISSSFTQPPPPVVMAEASKPQSSETPRVDRYVAPPKRDTEFGQPLKGKEIVDFPKVVGLRPNQYVPRVSNMLPSLVRRGHRHP